MRDPKRIDEILSAIKILWERSPDMRLGQLIYNVISTQDLKDGWKDIPDIFYVEDDKLLQALKEILKKGTW